MLQIKNIVKDYGDKDNIVHALKGVNLNFRDCELVSILGQSGCGKTTLLNIIGGLDRYTSGDLIIDGTSTKNYKDVDWDTYRNVRVGFIFQSYNLIMHTDIISNVEMALTLSGVSAKERRERAIKALEQVGLKDQIYKKPNQLSGGQMQRVSIARALINNPDILLADEPTGALDSATSIQIMDMIKEIAKDRLVIMVTHNPELAEKYSTRIVRLSDGEVVSDNNPYDVNEEVKDEIFATTVDIADNQVVSLSKKEQRKIHREKKKKLAKTSMSFITALKLSFNNLMTKKGRTILTSIAASIGIIGVSLVLAVSNGFSVYIDNMQKDMMSGYPITISQSGIDMATMMTLAMGKPSSEANVEYSDSNTVSTYSSIKKLTDMAAAMQNNNITEEYIEYLNTNLPKDSYGSVYCTYGMTMNIIGKPNVKIFSDTRRIVELTPGAKQYASMIFDGDANSEYQNITNMSMMFGLGELTGDKEFVESQYDCLYGSFPTNKSQMVLIVNEANQIGEFTMAALGLDPKKEYTFEEIISNSKTNKMKAYANDEYYYYDETEDYFKANDFISLYNSDKDCVELEIVGIYRAKKDVSYTTMSTGIHYSQELTQYILNKNYESEIVQAQRADENNYVLTLDHKFPGSASDSIGSMFGAGTSVTDQESALIVLGGLKTPIEVNIYPVNFEAKSQITAVLDKWNNEHSKEEQITYTDMASMIASMLSQMIKIITIALVCFSAVSLFVSSFMIAIITYVSVVERTKEIGILRALGARKKDISRVFNAETGIIGLVAGIIGVLITYILSIPINIIVNVKAGMVLNLCSLNPLTALAMIGLSIVLTLIAGLIPSRMAAKKDPVVALRTE